MADAPDPYLYPEVAAAGDLATLLQTEFDAAHAPLRAQRPASPGWARVSAETHAADRSASVVMAMHERAFLLQFWMRGVQMAQGSATGIADAAAATWMFLSGAPVRRLASVWPFVTFSGFAEAFERGESAAIAYRWQEYLDISSTRSLHLLDLHAFLTAAAAEPRLRALFPFTSHIDLGFRRSIGDPRDSALAWVRPHGEGRYLVTGPDRDRLGKPGPIRRPDLGPVSGALGPADPVATVALVLMAMTNSRG
ncbi:DUF6193 family natural product biosynthesis protein [Actinoplanes sp. NPDC051470]|uniref:DUF6193 family natural product biosynthesis protein n=1 Tax=unclassified Actinoplanes TaxID=2626549 RepID=UPI003418E93D